MNKASRIRAGTVAALAVHQPIEPVHCAALAALLYSARFEDVVVRWQTPGDNVVWRLKARTWSQNLPLLLTLELLDLCVFIG